MYKFEMLVRHQSGNTKQNVFFRTENAQMGAKPISD